MKTKFWTAFASIEQLDSTFIQRLYNYFGDVETAWNAKLSDLKQIEGLSIRKTENYIEKKKNVNPEQTLDFVKNKRENTIMKLYGVKNIFQNRDVINQIKETKLKKNGRIGQVTTAVYNYKTIDFDSEEELCYYVYNHEILKNTGGTNHQKACSVPNPQLSFKHLKQIFTAQHPPV
jgi:hypothetical protein